LLAKGPVSRVLWTNTEISFGFLMSCTFVQWHQRLGRGLTFHLQGTESHTSQKIYWLTKRLWFFFHSCSVHLDTIKVFYLPTDEQ